MAISENLKIIISGDASGAVKAFEQVGAKAGGFSANLTKAIQVGGVAALAAITAVAVGAVAVVKKAYDNWVENELIQSKLNNTIKNNGKETGVYAEMVNGLGKDIQKLTRFEDDNVVAAGEILARYKTIGKDVFPDALWATADLAEKLGIDMPEAAAMLGKALADPGEGLRVLKAAGVALDDQTLATIDKLMLEGKTGEAVGIILSELNGIIGGGAVAAGQTASGAIDRIKNSWDGVLDTIAEKMGPSIDKILNFFAAFVSSPEVLAFVDLLAIQIGNLTAYIATNLPMWTQQFQQFIAVVIANKDTILAVLTVIGVVVAAVIQGAVIGIAALMLPIAALVLAIAGIKTALDALKVWWDKTGAPFINGIVSMWNSVDAAIRRVISSITKAWGLFANGIPNIGASIPTQGIQTSYAPSGGSSSAAVVGALNTIVSDNKFANKMVVQAVKNGFGSGF